jgi:hypothetical protein
MERHNSALKESNCQRRLVYPAKLSFLFEGELKTFHNKKKLKGICDHQASSTKILKGLLHVEEETRVREEDSKKNKLF